MSLISDHKWRPLHKAGHCLWTACGYMNCRRPPAEHARHVLSVHVRRSRLAQEGR